MFAGTPATYTATGALTAPSTAGGGGGSGAGVAGTPATYVATAATAVPTTGTSTPKAGTPASYVATAATAQDFGRYMRIGGVLKNVRRITRSGLPPASALMPTVAPSGFTRVFSEDFNDRGDGLGAAFPEGAFVVGPAGGPNDGRILSSSPAYARYGPSVNLFPDGYPDTNQYAYNWPSRTVSTRTDVSGANGVMQIRLRTETIGGVVTALAAALRPVVAGESAQERDYGRLSMRIKADPVAGFGAVMLMIANNTIQGEIDWFEGGLSQAIHGYFHGTDGSQTEITTATPAYLSDWHVFTTERTPSSVKLYLDNVLVRTITAQMSTAPMKGLIQIGGDSGTPPPNASGVVLVDWITVDNYVPAQVSSANWSSSNVPYSTTQADSTKFMEGWPTSGLTFVNLVTGTGDLQTDVANTLATTNAAKVVIVLPGTNSNPQIQHLKAFRPYGTQTAAKPYLLAFWDQTKRLQGFLGQGPRASIVQLDTNAYSSDQLTPLKSMTKASFAPLLNAFARFDGTQAAPILLGGITFQGSDQPLLDTVASDVPSVVPQPAPYQGITFYPGSYYQVNDCRFIGCADAMMSQPPFEMGNVSSQRCFGIFRRCESDGRRAATIDPAQPRRCTVWMGNDEGQAVHQDCWLHHSNVSRYAANDEGGTYGTGGIYSLIRTRIDHIADLQNVDPNLNGGVTLDGYSDPSCAGWESSNAKITLTDCVIEQNNNHTTRAAPQHLSLTTTTVNRSGGLLTVNGGRFLNPGFPTVDGYLCVRAKADTAWVTSGLANTLAIYDSSGARKTAVPYSGSWPPPSSALTGTSPETHFIVKTN